MRTFWQNLLKQVHDDEQGALSLETVLIIGAISIPILIFLLKVGWPKVSSYFNSGLSDLQTDPNSAGGTGQ
jgi:Flp pilus assembly pilin Flp